MFGSIEITEDFLNKVEEFYTGEAFIEFLLNNSTDLYLPAYILQSLEETTKNWRDKINGTV